MVYIIHVVLNNDCNYMNCMMLLKFKKVPTISKKCFPALCFLNDYNVHYNLCKIIKLISKNVPTSYNIIDRLCTDRSNADGSRL